MTNTVDFFFLSLANKAGLPKSSKKAGARPCHSRMAIPFFSHTLPAASYRGDPPHMQGPIRASVASRAPHVRDPRLPPPGPTRRGITNMLRRTRGEKGKKLHDAGKWVPLERPKQGPGAPRGSGHGDRARRQAPGAPRGRDAQARQRQPPAPAPLRVAGK